MIYLAVFIFVLILGTFLGYIFHRMFHASWSGRFYKAHMTHHQKLYPANDFYSDSYRDPGKDNTFWLFLAAFTPLGIATALLMVFGVISISIGLVAIGTMSFIGFINNSLHDSFHLRKSFWHRFWFFDRLQKLHYIHHVDMTMNFGIFNFTWDKLLKTFTK
jgi:hypothetical protein